MINYEQDDKKVMLWLFNIMNVKFTNKIVSILLKLSKISLTYHMKCCDDYNISSSFFIFNCKLSVICSSYIYVAMSSSTTTSTMILLYIAQYRKKGKLLRQ